MKKKISVLVSALAALSIFATACDSKHTHTFSEDWESDATNHWHAATCEHGEEKSALAKHKDEDEDGKCDVCAYEVGHTHTYAEDWSKDDTHHWHAATCTHTDEVADKGLHEDAAADGTCDVCGGHAHVVNKAGVCDVCDEQVKPMDETNLEMVIAATALRYKNINTSTITYTYKDTIKSVGNATDGYGYSDDEYVITYTLGQNASKRVMTSDVDRYNDFGKTQETDKTELYIYTDAQDSVNPYKAIEIAYDTKDATEPANISNVNSSADAMHGYYYSISTFADAYGAENILAVLYELSQADTVSDYTFTQDTENNHYTFAFSSLVESGTETSGFAYNLFENTVDFEYTDTYELTKLTIETNVYTSDAGDGGADGGEADITLEEVNGEWVKKDGAIPNNYKFVTNQTVGERTYTHNISREQFVPSSFEFKLNGNAIANNTELEFTAEELEINLGDEVIKNTLTFDVDVPDGTYFNLAFGDDLLNPNITATIDNYGSAYVSPNGTLNLANLTGGTYNLSVAYLGTTVWSVTIEVEPYSQGGDVTLGEYEFTFTTTEFEWYTDIITFTATKGAGDYTLILPAGYGIVTIEAMNNAGRNPPVESVTPDVGGTYTMTLAANETHDFYIWAPRPVGEHTLTYNYEAKDVQGGDDVGGSTTTVDIKGSYTAVNDYNTSKVISIVITDTTVTFTQDSYSYTCDYTISNGAVALTKDGSPVASMFYGLTIEDGELVGATYNGNAYTVTSSSQGGGGDTNPVDITGTYYGTDN